MKTIELTNGEITKISDEDFPTVSQHKWYIKDRYPSTRLQRSKHTPLHQFLLGPYDTKKYVVDHIDRDPLNNTRENLRLVTRGQNAMNYTKKRKNSTSRYKGVYLYKRNGKWLVRFAGKHIGFYDNEEDAARAYNEVAFARYGSLVVLNTIQPHRSPPRESGEDSRDTPSYDVELKMMTEQMYKLVKFLNKLGVVKPTTFMVFCMSFEDTDEYDAASQNDRFTADGYNS